MLLAAASLAALLAWMEDRSDWLMLAAILLLGFGLARAYDRTFPTRSPVVRAIVLAVLSCVIATTLLGSLQQALGPVPVRQIPAQQMSHTIAHWLTAAWGLLPAASLLAVASAPRHPAHLRPPLWPLTTGLVGSLGLLLAGAFLWATVLAKWIEGTWDLGEDSLTLAPLLAESVLVGGLALLLWLRATRHRGEARFPRGGVLGQVMTATIAALAVGLAIGGLMLLTGPGRLAVASDPGIVFAAPLVGLLAACWITALWQFRSAMPTRPVGAILTIAVLLPPLGLSFVPPFWLIGSQGWFWIYVPVIVPITLALGFVIARLWPRLARMLLAI
jgi:hypothetical protein